MTDKPKEPEQSILTPRLLFLAACGSVLGGWIGMKGGLAWEKAKYGSIVIDDLVGSVGAYIGIMFGGFIGGAAGVFTDILVLEDKLHKASPDESARPSKSLNAPSKKFPASPEMETIRHTDRLNEKKAKKPDSPGI